MAGSNRRNFFRLAATEAARGAREVIPLVDPLASLLETPAPPQAKEPSAKSTEPASTEPGTPTSRTASIDEMLAIAIDLGLGPRAEDLRRLAVSSVRLTTVGRDDDGGGGGASFAGGRATLPAAVEVPDLGDDRARFVALFQLPSGDRLWVFRAEPEPAPAYSTGAENLATSPQGAAVLELAGDAGAEPMAPPPGATSLFATHELTLPRPWSAAVESLDLSTEEQDSWQELRTRLARAQGVTLGESAPPDAATHRLGGFPDERRGDMPMICELRLLGVDLEGRHPATHPLAGALEGETGNWRMLAQLSADDDLGWSWGPRRERLYVWGRLEDPASSGFDSVQVVIQ